MLHSRLLIVAIVGASASASGAAGAESCDTSDAAVVTVGYTLYRAVDPEPTGQFDPHSPSAGGGASAQAPCSPLIAEHLQTTQAIFAAQFAGASQFANVDLDFLSAVSGGCAGYEPITGALAEYVNDSAVQIFTGPQRQTVIDDFKEEMSAANLYDTDTVNVYYVWDKHLTGLHVRKRDGDSENLIFLGRGADIDSLAHEFAHAFSLAHVNFFGTEDLQTEYCAEYEYFDDRCDFTRGNLMWVVGDPEDEREERHEILEGQKLRMLCNGNSALVANGDYAPDVEMDCPDWSVAGACPPLNP